MNAEGEKGRGKPKTRWLDKQLEMIQKLLVCMLGMQKIQMNEG